MGAHHTADIMLSPFTKRSILQYVSDCRYYFFPEVLIDVHFQSLYVHGTGTKPSSAPPSRKLLISIYSQ